MVYAISYKENTVVWYIEDKGYNEILIKEVEVESTDTWGIQLSASNITPTGIIMECNQLGGEPTGDLQTGSYYFIEKQMNEEWVAVKMLPSEYEIGWDDVAWIIPMDDTVEWEINWEWLYGELSEGNYRMGKKITDFRNTGDYDTKIYYTNFEIVK